MSDGPSVPTPPARAGRADSLAGVLRERLDRLAADGLRRVLRRIETPAGTVVEWEGRRLTNFSSNDYLGLAGHPAVREAAQAALRQWGGGSTASRLICGSLGIHHELEESLARLKRTEAALTFGSGFLAALGAITSLVGTGDVVAIDRLAHACIVDAARLSGARLRVFAHNDPGDLEQILRWAADRRRNDSSAEPGRVLVVTESLFSMDGDRAPLRELVELKDRYGAWLMVDEAHATGVLGPEGRGLAAESGVDGRIEVQMGTLGKALGAAGGFIAGGTVLIDWLVNRARSFVFTTAPVPAAAGAARAALGISTGEEGEQRRAALRARIAQLRQGLGQAGWSLPPVDGPILPVIIGDERAAVEVSTRLRDDGLLVPAVRYPTVARGSARLRVTVSAAHGADDVERLCSALARAVPVPPPGTLATTP